MGRVGHTVEGELDQALQVVGWQAALGEIGLVGRHRVSQIAEIGQAEALAQRLGQQLQAPGRVQRHGLDSRIKASRHVQQVVDLESEQRDFLVEEAELAEFVEEARHPLERRNHLVEGHVGEGTEVAQSRRAHIDQCRRRQGGALREEMRQPHAIVGVHAVVGGIELLQHAERVDREGHLRVGAELEQGAERVREDADLEVEAVRAGQGQLRQVDDLPQVADQVEVGEQRA